MTCREAGDTQYMDIVLHRLFSCLCRSLEQGSHIDIKAAIGITGGYHFGATIMAVLSHLGNHDTGLTTFFLGKLCRETTSFLEVIVVLST